MARKRENIFSLDSPIEGFAHGKISLGPPTSQSYVSREIGWVESSTSNG